MLKRHKIKCKLLVFRSYNSWIRLSSRGRLQDHQLCVDDQFLFFNPKAGLTYSLSEAKIYFSYAKAQREPNRTDYENGSPKPEKLE